MSAEAGREVLRRRPFEPLAVVTFGVWHYAVMQPECTIVSPTRAVVLEPVKDKLTILPLMHMNERRPVADRRS
jgi:hypothetical protein